MSYSRRRFLAASAGMALAGCGGTGSSTQQYVGTPPPLKPRTDIAYGYFGDGPNQAIETAAHANLYLSAPWYGIDGAIANIRLARAAGFPELVVMVDADAVAFAMGDSIPAGVAFARGWMSALRDAGCFAGMRVRALYWRDEPNDDSGGLPARSDAYVRQMNAAMRAMLTADFPELGAVGMWTIFADRPDLPGLNDWDGAGGDRYGQGCNVLGGNALIDRIGRGMKPGAGRILVPAGVTTPDAGPLLDPGCFEIFAQGTPDVIAVIAFLWIDGWGGKPENKGIRTVAPAAYAALGHQLTRK